MIEKNKKDSFYIYIHHNNDIYHIYNYSHNCIFLKKRNRQLEIIDRLLSRLND